MSAYSVTGRLTDVLLDDVLAAREHPGQRELTRSAALGRRELLDDADQGDVVASACQ
jgi:hypothetical protein